MQTVGEFREERMKRRDKGKKQRGVGVEDHPDHEKEEEIAENSKKEEWKEEEEREG